MQINLLTIVTFFPKGHKYIGSTWLQHSDLTTYKEKGEKVIILTMDITRAYECFDKCILQKILQELSYPSEIISWSRSLISCISPIIFNIYTSGLHGVADERTHIFQYADDFVILTHYKEQNNALIFSFKRTESPIQPKKDNYVCSKDCTQSSSNITFR